jgi:hypothetical protein
MLMCATGLTKSKKQPSGPRSVAVFSDAAHTRTKTEGGLSVAWFCQPFNFLTPKSGLLRLLGMLRHTQADSSSAQVKAAVAHA